MLGLLRKKGKDDRIEKVRKRYMQAVDEVLEAETAYRTSESHWNEMIADGYNEHIDYLLLAAEKRLSAARQQARSLWLELRRLEIEELRKLS